MTAGRLESIVSGCKNSENINFSGGQVPEFEEVLIRSWIESIKDVEKPIVEDSFHEAENWYAVAYRLKTGFDSDVVHYSEVIVVKFNDEDSKLTPTKFAEICSEIYAKDFFRYHHYHENLFSRTVFIFARRSRGVLEPRRAKNTLFVPVIAKRGGDATAIACMYLANFFGKRLFRVLNAVLQGRLGKPRNFWNLFRAVRSGRIESIKERIGSIMRYIIELVSELERRVSSSVINTVKVLFNLFEKLLTAVDKIERPKALKKKAERLIEFARKELKIPLIRIPKMLEFAKNVCRDMDRAFARKYVELLSSSHHIK